MTEQPDNWQTPQNILVILAHPDDPEFFCGATLARWARAGHHITYLLLTCGDKGFNPTTHPEMTPDKLCSIRHEEQYAAAKVIGAEAVHFMEYPDGYLTADLDTRRAVVREIRRFKPDILLTCDPQTLFAVYGINHPDHRAAAQAACEAVFPSAGSRLIFADLLPAGYEPHDVKRLYIHGTEKSNTWVDVSETLEIKIKALQQHVSQIDPNEVGKWLTDWAADEGKDKGMKYAESFRVMILKRDEEEQAKIETE